MEIVPFLMDPTIRQIAGPAIGNALSWTVTTIRQKFTAAPQPVQSKVLENTEAFAELLAAKVAAKVNMSASAQEAINSELGGVKGFSALQKAVEVSAEIDDEFTRETLAELVTRRLSSTEATRLQLGTRIATQALLNLGEQHLRLLAFMIFVQGLRPSLATEDADLWTKTVLNWVRTEGPAVVVSVDSRDLALLASTGLVDLMPRIIQFELPLAWSNEFGLKPDIESFLAEDELGKRINAAYDLTKYHRLNLAGTILGATIADRIVGGETDISQL